MPSNLFVFAKEEAEKSLISKQTWFCLTVFDRGRNHLVDR